MGGVITSRTPERTARPRASRVEEKVSRKATRCETCGKELEYRGVGRPRKFCGPGCYAVAHNERRRVVPKYLYDPEHRTYVANPARRPKSKVY